MKRTQGNLRKSYKTYKASYGGYVDVKTYLHILSSFFKFLSSKVLEGYEITFPLRMGTLRIRGIKREIRFKEDGTPNLPVDYAGTKKLWKTCKECEEKKQVVYHTNEHTDGIAYSYFWSKKSIFVENKEFYSLLMTRANKRAVPRMVEQGKQYAVKI